jgi:phage terminase small subunit
MNIFNPEPIVIIREGSVADPPTSLDDLGTALWRSILTQRRLTTQTELAILEQACHAYQRAESLREQIDDAGELLASEVGTIKANPCIALELQARALCARLLDRLNPAEDKRGPGRPANRRPSY